MDELIQKHAVIKDSFSYDDFEIGENYQISIKNWESPTGEVIQGKVKICEVLEPANVNNSTYDGEPATEAEVNNLSAFLRVYDPVKRSIHLIAFETIKSFLKLTR